VDQSPTALRQITSTGFDLSGLDFHTGGLIEKNISFYVLPSFDATGAFHFETVFGRIDNLFGSSWLNLKLGKFELDNLVSEKRIVTLTKYFRRLPDLPLHPAGGWQHLRSDRR